MKQNFFIEQMKFVVFKIIIICLIVVSSNEGYAQGNKCKAVLKVENGIQKKKANFNGTSYKLTLTNKSDYTNTFYINIDEEATAKLSTSSRGVYHGQVESEILNSNYKKINHSKSNFRKKEYLKDNKKSKPYEVSLNSNESVIFFVSQKISKNLRIGSKNSSKIVVTSRGCESFKVEKILETEITDCCDE